MGALLMLHTSPDSLSQWATTHAHRVPRSGEHIYTGSTQSVSSWMPAYMLAQTQTEKIHRSAGVSAMQTSTISLYLVRMWYGGFIQGWGSEMLSLVFMGPHFTL